ncbi:MAG: TolC family protein, partial [Gammaproteobacteria bacterium]|nr:TolC family protein [Gammaproteobacteria bacterium]
RPDVRVSEYNLQSLSANVAAARAAMFPTITLSTSIGFGSRELGNLLGSGNNTWSFVPQIRWPIFDGGSARAAVDVAQANRDIAVAQYEKSIQTAFREVSDALAERAQWQERLSAQQAVVDANARAFELSEARFTSGVDNYLTVLDAQRSLYAAQQTLIGLRQSEQANRVALWKVLGGQLASAAEAPR